MHYRHTARIEGTTRIPTKLKGPPQIGATDRQIDRHGDGHSATSVSHTHTQTDVRLGNKNVAIVAADPQHTPVLPGLTENRLFGDCTVFGVTPDQGGMSDE